MRRSKSSLFLPETTRYLHGYSVREDYNTVVINSNVPHALGAPMFDVALSTETALPTGMSALPTDTASSPLAWNPSGFAGSPTPEQQRCEALCMTKSPPWPATSTPRIIASSSCSTSSTTRYLHEGWAWRRHPVAGPLAELQMRLRPPGCPLLDEFERGLRRRPSAPRVAVDRRRLRARRDQLLQGPRHDPGRHAGERGRAAQHRPLRHRRAHGAIGARVSPVPQASGRVALRVGDPARRTFLLLRRGRRDDGIRRAGVGRAGPVVDRGAGRDGRRDR